MSKAFTFSLSLSWTHLDEPVQHPINVCFRIDKRVIRVISVYAFGLCAELCSLSLFILTFQRTARCSWWGKWAVMMRGSCTPWRFWRKPQLYKRQKLLNTHGRSGKCWSTSVNLHSSSHFTTPSRRIPSCTSFSVFYRKLPALQTARFWVMFIQAWLSFTSSMN